MPPGARVAGRAVAALPAPLRDPAQRRPLLGWLGVGLAVRLALMPLTVSADLLAVYWRSHLIAHHGEVFGGYLVNMGAHYLHALGLWLMGPLLPPAEEVWTHPWWWADMSALAPQFQRAFAEAAHAHQTLFALKLPYLAADLAAGLLLLVLVGAARPALVRRAWIFWMLSPIGLYATYLFGRYEALAVVLVVAAVLLVERERPWWAALVLGLAITVRTYPLLLVPVFALVVAAAAPSVRARVGRGVGWALAALAPFVAVMASNQVLAGTVGEVARLREAHTGQALFAFTLPVDGTGDLLLFVAFAVLLYGLLAGRVLGWWAGPPRREELWIWLLVLHAGMFALATVSAHYLMWLTPFVAIALARRPSWRGAVWLHLAQVAIVLALADVLGGTGVLLGLFQPLHSELAGAWPSLRELLLTSPALHEQVASVLRTAFLAVTVLWAWPALAELHRSAFPAALVPAQPPGSEQDGPGEQPQPADREPGRAR